MVRLPKRVHCIGIGGAGMAPLAELLLSRGCRVTGSDRERSQRTERLERLGIEVQYGHEPRLVEDAQVVVYSSAIGPDNTERRHATARGLAQIRRAEVLGDLMRGAFSIGVSGTHGKTTTTAMVGHILTVAGMRPTLLVGGEMAETGSHAVVGGEEYVVTEADEYDRSFLALHPTLAAVTNIEEDHLDCYRDLEDIQRAFAQFVSQVPFYGAVILGIDSPAVGSIASSARGEVVTCAVDSDADYRARFELDPGGATVVTVCHGGEPLGRFELTLPGVHNVRNALTAAVVAMRAGVSFDDVCRAMPCFRGVRRRMEVVGRAAGVVVVDDYAHHPSEVRATLAGLSAMSFRRTVVIFQPHLYSRTRDFLDGFVESLAVSDVLVVVDIYAARESPIPGVSAQAIIDGVRARGHRAAHHVAHPAQAVDLVAPLVREGDVVVFMGAGDIGMSGPRLVEHLAK